MHVSRVTEQAARPLPRHALLTCLHRSECEWPLSPCGLMPTTGASSLLGYTQAHQRSPKKKRQTRTQERNGKGPVKRKVKSKAKPNRMNLALARQKLKDTKMMQKIPRILHLGNDTDPRTKPPRAKSTLPRLCMPVVLTTTMRTVLQNATQSATSLILLAQNATKLAITPINAFSDPKTSTIPPS